MSDICTSIYHVRDRVAAAENRFCRPPDSVAVLAVSKTRRPEDILAAVQCGQRRFGESYLQEALPKIRALSDHPIEWHFIGPIQSNKTRPIAESFDWVHSVDRLKIAKRLSDQRPPSLPPLNTCLQVNISREPSKQGAAMDKLLPLAKAISDLPRIKLRGLMAIPAPGLAVQRVPYHQLRQLFEQLKSDGLPLDTLSMGMTGDLEAAIAEGATIIRIGAGIFGPRAPHPPQNGEL